MPGVLGTELRPKLAETSTLATIMRWIFNKAGGGRGLMRAPKDRILPEEGQLSCDVMEVRMKLFRCGEGRSQQRVTPVRRQWGGSGLALDEQCETGVPGTER